MSRKETLEDIKGRLVQTEARQQGQLGPAATSMPMVHLAVSASDDRLAALEKHIDNLTTQVRATNLTHTWL
jgi:hypothetical protein